MIKALRKPGIEGMYFNIAKAVYDKPTANIILNVEKLKLFPLKSGARQGCPPIQHSRGIPRQSNKARRRNKRNTIDKETVKISPFADDMMLYLKDPKNSTQKLLDTINSCSKVAGYKINLQKPLAFLNTNNEQTEKEYMEIIPFTIASKKIKYLGVNLTKDVNDPLQGELQTPEERDRGRLQKMERSPMLMDW
jgi:hypothetical protein